MAQRQRHKGPTGHGQVRLTLAFQRRRLLQMSLHKTQGDPSRHILIRTSPVSPA